jgi:hypothetical protein
MTRERQKPLIPKKARQRSEPPRLQPVSPLALPQTKTKQRKPLGSVIDWTDEDLDTMSEILPTDIKTAEALWRAEAPSPLRGLVSAKVEEQK